MSITAWRVVVWILGVLSLAGLVAAGHASWAKQGIFNVEFLAFVLSNMAYIKCIETEYRLREKKNG